jgi:hypothetical protein
MTSHHRGDVNNSCNRLRPIQNTYITVISFPYITGLCFVWVNSGTVPTGAESDADSCPFVVTLHKAGYDPSVEPISQA